MCIKRGQDGGRPVVCGGAALLFLVALSIGSYNLVKQGQELINNPGVAREQWVGEFDGKIDDWGLTAGKRERYRRSMEDQVRVVGPEAPAGAASTTNSSSTVAGVPLVFVGTEDERITEDRSRSPTPKAWLSGFFRAENVPVAWISDGTCAWSGQGLPCDDDGGVALLFSNGERRRLSLRAFSPELIWDDVSDDCARTRDAAVLRACCANFYDVVAVDVSTRRVVKSNKLLQQCAFRGPLMDACVVVSSTTSSGLQACKYPLSRPEKQDAFGTYGVRKGMESQAPWKCGGLNAWLPTQRRYDAETEACRNLYEPVATDLLTLVNRHQALTQPGATFTLVVRSPDDPKVWEEVMTNGTLTLPNVGDEDVKAGLIQVGIGIGLAIGAVIALVVVLVVAFVEARGCVRDRRTAAVTESFEMRMHRASRA